jgi:predicted flavoprotein YhiN
MREQVHGAAGLEQDAARCSVRCRVSGPRRVVVVGAGAAGLTAALRAAEGGARVTLLNAHPRIGLKILMSGGTRCNVTHREVNATDFHGGSRNVVARILRAFTPAQTIEWMESIGVKLKLEETGKYFPETDDAQTVLDALVGAVTRAGVEVVSGARVVRLEREAGGFRLGIQRVADATVFAPRVAPRARSEWPLVEVEPDERREADAVIVATGGLSFPRTGSDGTGYGLLAALGHTLTPTVPALTPLTASDPLCERLQGVTVMADLTLWSGAKKAAETSGSFLFAHFGYSGPAALDMSRHWLMADPRQRRLTSNFAKGKTREQVLEAWLAASREGGVTVRRFMAGWLPERVVTELCHEAGVEPSRVLGQVPKSGRERLITTLCARVLPVDGTLGYEKAEVTAGGVVLSEVDPSTLESRVVPGLFLCGEVLDVEGRLGGFNFQWAWSSGTVAGRAAASRE